jgi:hypothetical protein
VEAAPPAAVVVVVVNAPGMVAGGNVVCALLEFEVVGRVPTATRMATATTNTTSTAAARAALSEPDIPPECCGPSSGMRAAHFDQPDLPPRPVQAFRLLEGASIPAGVF